MLSIYYFSGAFGNVITPFIQNQAVVDGTRNTNFSCSSTPEPPGIFSWFVFPLGGDRILIAAGSRSRNAADFDLLTDDKESRLVVKIASVSRAGVCYCQLGADVHFAQLIVVSKYLHGLLYTRLYCIQRIISRPNGRRFEDLLSAVREAVHIIL